MIIKIETAEQFLEVVPLILEYAKQPRAPIALDLETFGPNKKKVPRPTLRKDGTYDGYIRTMQIGFSTSEKLAIRDIQIIIDVKKIGCKLIAHYLKDVLENSIIIGQNLKYEWQFLWVHMGIRLRKMRDTMLMSQILKAGDKVNHGLGDHYGRYLEYGWFESYCANHYGQSPWFQAYLVAKEEFRQSPQGKAPSIFDFYKRFKDASQKRDWELDDLNDDDYQYGADDVCLIFAVFDGISAEVQQWREVYEAEVPQGKGMVEVIRKECELIPAFARMELRGIKLDREYQQTVVIRYLKAKMQEAIDKLGFTVKKTIVHGNEWCILKTRKQQKCAGICKITGKPNRIVWEEEIDVPLNMNSPAQLKPKLNQILRDALGITEDLDDDDEEVLSSTKEDVLRDLINRRRKELSPQVIEQLKWVLQYKKSSSLLSKFGQKMIDLASDRDYIHANFHQIGTDTEAVSSGRSSASKPNMMQMPSRGVLFVSRWVHKDGKDIPLLFFDTGDLQDGISVMHFFRQAFIAEEGWVLLDADYSQEEPRIAAEMYEPLLVKDFVSFGKKADVHSIFGKAFCGLSYYPKKGEFERDYIGKTGGLQLIYGAYWPAFRDFMFSKTDGKVDWDDKEAEGKYNTFFEQFPNLRKAMNAARRDAERLPEQWGWNLTPAKKFKQPYHVVFSQGWWRKRSFHLKQEHAYKPDFMLAKGYKPPVVNEETGEPEIDENGKVVTTYKNIYRERVSAAAREGFNHTIQGTAADILKDAVLMIETRFEQAGFDWREGIVAVIHDEVLAHVKKEHAELAAKIIRESMIEAWDRYFKQVPMYVDCDGAKNWADAKEPPKVVAQ